MDFKRTFIAVLAAIIVSFMGTSCASVYYDVLYQNVYDGNQFDKYVGKDKNLILRELGAPDRTMDDGRGGEVLVYEKTTTTTTTNIVTKSSASGYSESAAVGVYTKSGVAAGVGASGYDAQAQSKTNTTQNTTTNKTFVNFFVNGNGSCYDFKANYGAKYKTEKVDECFCNARNWGVSLLIVPLWPITIPTAAINQAIAKKRGWKFCNKK